MTVVDSCIFKENDTFYIDTTGKELVEVGGIVEGDAIRFKHDGQKYIGTVRKFESEEKDLYILKNVHLVKPYDTTAKRNQ
jgi:hypothetical protein